MEEPIDLNDATYNRRSSYRALAAAKEWAWVVSKRRTVTRLSSAPLGPWGNPGVGTVTIELSEGSGTSNPTLIAAIGGTVWVGDRGAPAVYRIEGVVDKPKKVTLEGKGGIRAMAVTPTELWLLRENGSLTRVDALARDQLTQPLDAPATAIAVGPDDALWLLDGPRRNVRTADPGTGATTETVEVGGKPVNAVVAGGSLWVTIVGE
jgi:hypothetical protein